MYRRELSIVRRPCLGVLLAAVIAFGQFGALVHGLLHVVDVAAHAIERGADDAHEGHDHGDRKACNAFDGFVDAAACGACTSVATLAQVASGAAHYYLRNVLAPFGYSSRAPPSLLA